MTRISLYHGYLGEDCMELLNSSLGPSLQEWDEADLVPLSALQHYSYCPRQYGLIYLEQVWEIAEKIRALNAADVLPKAVYDARCVHCSLREACMPEVADGHLSSDWSDWQEAMQVMNTNTQIHILIIFNISLVLMKSFLTFSRLFNTILVPIHAKSQSNRAKFRH